MGLLDRFLPKKPVGPARAVPPPPEPASAPLPPAAAENPAEITSPEPPAVRVAPVTPAPAVSSGGVLARLKQARDELQLKNRAGAMAVYEEIIASAGDRADVLVTISGDLGVTGHTREIIELIAPRYDAQRHGPATGINLLQAYLAVRDPEAAQHVLDLLFALNRPELEERLLGFSNVIADMMLLAAEGEIAPAPSDDPATDFTGVKMDLVSISKPVWYYGLENIPGLLPPKNGTLRRVAFGQLAVLGLKDATELMKQPEDENGRLSRGIPLWLSELLFFSTNYTSVAGAATMQRQHYGIFNSDWAPEHIRQLVESTEGGLDYVFTGSLRQQHSDYELTLRLWEVKKFRERKTFSTRWTPATASQALAQLHAQLVAFMEFAPHPAGQGLVYALPPRLYDYIEGLGGALTLFLGEKQVLAPTQLVVPPDLIARVQAAAGESEFASLLAQGMSARAQRLGLPVTPAPSALAATPAVEQARKALGL